MNSENAAQTHSSVWLLCVTIFSFMHTSFFMPSKNTTPYKMVTSTLLSSEAPLAYLGVSLSSVSMVPVLLFPLMDSSGIGLSVSGAMLGVCHSCP